MGFGREKTDALNLATSDFVAVADSNYNPDADYFANLPEPRLGFSGDQVQAVVDRLEKAKTNRLEEQNNRDSSQLKAEYQAAKEKYDTTINAFTEALYEIRQKLVYTEIIDSFDFPLLSKEFCEIHQENLQKVFFEQVFLRYAFEDFGCDRSLILRQDFDQIIKNASIIVDDILKGNPIKNLDFSVMKWMVDDKFRHGFGQFDDVIGRDWSQTLLFRELNNLINATDLSDLGRKLEVISTEFNRHKQIIIQNSPLLKSQTVCLNRTKSHLAKAQMMLAALLKLFASSASSDQGVAS